ncbi:hypothetical protein [Cyanobium sp. Morenito 9A2]|uniref:hypothetical protein n=1 Tax=Cyanobium sp. Morenito 9A2 TaxID=2823718 RepID=UPI0020CD38EA|nr:hypothetical protein [Cyanobium sp. Morenito 9A2]MCP9848557.1 hypothetical protein [Cyanobium sp. Morenito 9A2]
MVLPLGIAVALHALWLAGASLLDARRPAPALLSSGDDTPELLRFSRRASQLAGQQMGPLTGLGRANLSMVPLPLDSTLPPPPPDLAFGGAVLALRGAKPAGSGRGAAQRAANRPPVPTAPPPLRLAELVPAERSSLAGLPDDPLVAFRLVAALDPTPGGAADGAAAETSGDKGSPTPAAAAIARRHLRLIAGGEKPFLALWQKGRPLTPRPAALGDLPEGVELRSLPLALVRRLGLSQPHGLSISYGTSRLLLWVEGDELWLIQQKDGIPSNPA